MAAAAAAGSLQARHLSALLSRSASSCASRMRSARLVTPRGGHVYPRPLPRRQVCSSRSSSLCSGSSSSSGGSSSITGSLDCYGNIGSCCVRRTHQLLRPSPVRASAAAGGDGSIATTVTSADAEKVQEPEQQLQPQQKKGNKGGKAAKASTSPSPSSSGEQASSGKGAGEGSKIAPRSENFSRWYLDVIREAQLADYGPVRGTMVIRPYGYAIWEAIQSWLDNKFKETGHQNMYFPQFIPYSFIEKEASHVEGFSPELALVTIGGGKELEERLVVRPTSETIVNHMFAQWVNSYRDLPLLINQWANVTRWEMSTRPFVRTLEFLWQEGHTAHATAEEAEEEALKMVEVYRQFAWEQAAVPVVVGRKSRNETFAGAVRTYTIEAMMGDRKALQAGTSHNLGQNFAKAFGTQYLAEDGSRQHVWQTSWGVSTRMVGAVIMGHGDDMGLMLPPNLAPTQVVIVPIWKKESEKESTQAAAQEVDAGLKSRGIRCFLDSSEQRTPGWKFNHWEMKGVPVRIEIGPRDVASCTVVVARRDVPGKAGKQFGVAMEGDVLAGHVRELLASVQDALLAKALKFRDENIVDVTSYEELKEAIAQGKWARGPWCASDDEEKRVKEETTATIRCFPFDQPEGGPWPCLMTGEPASEVAIFAKSY